MLRNASFGVTVALGLGLTAVVSLAALRVMRSAAIPADTPAPGVPKAPIPTDPPVPDVARPSQAELSQESQPEKDSAPLLDPAAMEAEDAGPPIPQSPEQQQQLYSDTLEWNRRTLGGAYERVGKRDSRWDKTAREALEATARHFSLDVNPSTGPQQVNALTRQAIDAGCDDPLVLYVYARSSKLESYPGPEEFIRRHTAAAAAMEQSNYPPFRRGVALHMGGGMLMTKKEPSPEDRAEASRMLDASLALLGESAAKDERDRNMEHVWYDWPRSVYSAYRKLTKDRAAAFDRVDAAMAGIPEIGAQQLQVKADFLIEYAWEARGEGYADTVTEDGWRKMHARLSEARAALEEAWRLKPGDAQTATAMITINMGLDGDRNDMETWFARAMEADGNNRDACRRKLAWVEPKWHGSPEQLLAFGRACSDTKNWRAGITLLVADAHLRLAQLLPKDEYLRYLRSDEVYHDIVDVYEEYLDHFPWAHVERSNYAVFNAICARPTVADLHFKALGDQLVGTPLFGEDYVHEMRDFVARRIKAINAGK